jgi:hypothetical protein
MKIRKILLWMYVITSAVVLSPVSLAADNVQYVPWRSVPAVAQDVVTANTMGLQGVKLISTKTGQSYQGQKLSKEAKISISEARAIALKAQAGQLADEELEKENGGSGLRYSFDIKTSDGVHEVGIDAVSGVVLENSVEGGNRD